ncbi:MAG TPA: hypothetical protein VHG09_14585 [Longimicrobiales bacterium]|nr:hypothetical protein [Longimicrobiales bacterium]
MGRKLPWPEIIVSAIVLALGVSVYAYAHRHEDELEESKNRGALIVSGLDRYFIENGTYPEQLSELVPTHIAAIEPPAWGLERWRYRRYVPQHADETEDTSSVYFQLSVAADESGYPVLYYDFATRRWVLNN